MTTIIIGFFATVVGVLLEKFKLIKPKFSRLLGHQLYYFGLPIQIFAVAHNTKFIKDIWFPPLITILVLLSGFFIANLNLFYGKQLCYVILTNSWKKNWFTCGDRNKQINLPIPQNSSGRGSFILSSTLGSTGYLGLAIVPIFVNSAYSGWAVLYSVTQILFGSFGMGILVANYYGSSAQKVNCSIQLRELLKVPSLWAFVLGWCSRSTNLALLIDWGLKLGVLLAIAGAFLLTGIQIQRIRVNYLNRAIAPALIKMLVIPGLTGLCLSLFGVTGDARLSMVLMSGMPTANTNLILAQKYNLDCQVTASTIAVTTMLLPMMVLMWRYIL